MTSIDVLYVNKVHSSVGLVNSDPRTQRIFISVQDGADLDVDNGSWVLKQTSVTALY
jgi:hypothetical protein